MPDPDRLYALLPAIHRIRDAQAGQPLRALLAVLESQLALVEADVARLHDDWFIETCQEWVVPYLGDLLGVRGLRPLPTTEFSQRALVANTLRYRRRKGTAAMLEQLALDVTGWPARAVELFQRLGTTQHLNHVRPDNLRTPDLRDTSALALLGGPFERAAHAADVRPMETRLAPPRGRYNLPNVALHLWRLQAFPVEDVPAAAEDAALGRWRFSPAGIDEPLFNPRRTETTIAHLAEEVDLPAQLRRRALWDALEAQRAARARGETVANPWFPEGAQVFRVFLDDAVVPAEWILICDLEHWHEPPSARRYLDAMGAPVLLPIAAAVDPHLGRIALPAGARPNKVRVSWYRGFSAEIGGGGYRRGAPAGGEAVSGGGAALQQRLDAGNLPAVLRIDDSESYDLSGLTLPANGRLAIRAADRKRPLLRLPGAAAVTLGAGAHLDLEGVLIVGGSLEVSYGDGASVGLEHTTIAPGGALVAKGSGVITVSIGRSIVGRVDLPGSDGDAAVTGELRATDSILDGAGGVALRAGHASLERCTVLGGAEVAVLEASECLLRDRAIAARTQQGCVRFSWVHPDSRVPRRYRCQPALAEEAAAASGAETLAQVRLRVRPLFTSERWGDPGYAQLARACCDEIRRGAEDEGEMGAFHLLAAPHREANLRATLDEYLPFGLEAGLFFET